MALAPLVAAQAADGAASAAHDAWIVRASEGLDARAVETLALIDGPARQLLAMRAYLRTGDSLARRWSGSQQQSGLAAMAALDSVLRVFAAANPGYVLRVNRDPRSLELQIRRWNENASVAAVAAALLAALDGQYPAGRARPNAQQLKHALTDWHPAIEAPLAAPGLSAHGQGRAFDFQVTVALTGRVIAGPDAALARTRWDAAGWTAKLKLAVNSAGQHFSGPLESPYEPWHYAYTPALQ